MNEFKFDFDYIKKNCNQKKFLKDIMDLNSDDMFLNIMASCFDHDLNVISDLVDYEIISDDYCDKKNQEFKLIINKCQFDGTLLPKLSDDFKLELHFDFGIRSFYTISSKIKKNYLYIFCDRLSFNTERLYDGSPTTVYDKHNLCDNFVKLVLKEKLTKVQFFEQILKWEKEPGTTFSRGSGSSTYGVDYYDLYKKGKL